MHDVPLGWRTDIEVLRRSGAQITESAGHVVVRSPDNPGYYWGNFVYIGDPALAADPEGCLALMRRSVPDVTHVAIGLPGPPAVPAWQALGITVECDEVLVADRPPAGRPLPEGYHARELRDADDWEQAVSKELAEAGSPSDPAYEEFVRRRVDSRRRMVSNGDAAFMGVFLGDRLVADLGIVLCAGPARYQSVGTDPAHRGRGLASHLLHMAGEWAEDRGATRWVIVADRGSDAARLYRRCGLRPAAHSWQVYRTGET